MAILIIIAVWALILLVAGAPFVPTRRQDVDLLFKELGPGNGRRFLDCGAGDGRLVVAAAGHGFEAVGYELNPLVWAVAQLRTWPQPAAQVKFGRWQTQRLGDYGVVYFFGTGPHLKRALNHQTLPPLLVSYGFKPTAPTGRFDALGPFWLLRQTVDK